MITAEQAGLTEGQYTALTTHVDGANLAAVHQLVLTRYAPVWLRKTSPFAVGYKSLDCALVSGGIKAAAWNGTTSVVIADLANEDTADQTWLNTTPTTLGTAPADMSYSTAANWFWTTPTTGANFTSPFDGGATRTISGLSLHKFLSAVGVGGYACHIIGTTTKGNWRLAYYSAETFGGGTWVSDIYWPYQVRSFDAARMDGYDIIALETDLPPIDDWTVSGTKTTMVAQRVQGIVVFKFDYVNHIWSSHYVMDQVDNQHDRSLGHIKFTEYDGMVYATYFRNHNGTMVLCVSKSADGINWENPIYLPELADSDLTIAEHSPVVLIRNGDQMYLVGAGATGSGQTCFRALATDYMGMACADNTLDATEYVTNLSLSIDNRRVASVTLGDPTVNVADTGYGLSGLLRGEVSNHDLLDDLRAMRARLSLGYNHAVGDISSFTLVNVPVLESTVEMTLAGFNILSDDGYGSLRVPYIDGSDTAVLVISAEGELVRSTHAMNYAELVPGTVELTCDGETTGDDGVGGIDVTIPAADVSILAADMPSDPTLSITFDYPAEAVSGECVLTNGTWTITDDGVGGYESVPDGITGTIEYETRRITLVFDTETNVDIYATFSVVETSASGTVDYDTGEVSIIGLTLPEAYALAAVTSTFAYSRATIRGTINYLTGECVINVDGIETIEATYMTAGGSQSETITATREDILVDQLYGLVSKVKETPGLDGSVVLEVQDLSVLATVSGNSDSNEWLGVESGGDNFAPMYDEDTSGASGLKHTIIKTGAWTGSATGLKHSCDDDEGVAITDLIKRSMNCAFMADIDFYCGIQSPVKTVGGTAADALDNNEYAGLGIRMKDQHAGWWVRITPNADNTSDFQLMFRRSVTTEIPGVDGEAATYEVTHVDTTVGSPVISPAVTGGYDDYYAGRITVRAYYNIISVQVIVGLGNATTLLSYEAIGMGNNEFLAPVGETTYDRPTLEGGLADWPYTYGYCAYIAKGTGIFVDYGSDAEVEVAANVTDLDNADTYVHGSSIETRAVNTDTSWTFESLRSILCTTQTGVYAESGFKYEIGDGTLAGTPLGLTGITKMRFKADVYIQSSDENARLRVKAKVWFNGGQAWRNSVEYTNMQEWNHFEATCDNIHDLTIDGVTFFFYDPDSIDASSPIVFSVDNIRIEHEESQREIYFGNAMISNEERCYTTEDAQQALYAYSGLHDVTADDKLLGEAWSDNELAEVADSPIFFIPFVADFEVTSDYAMIYPLAIATDDTPIQIEIASGVATCLVRVKESGDDIKVSAPCSSAKGRLRVVVSTLSSEGVVYSQDTTLVKDWLTVLVYVGDRKVLSGVFPVYPETTIGDRLLFGSSGGTMSFDSIRVSVAGRVTDVFSIDPGETASNPLGRLLGTSSIVPVSQSDGSLRLKKVQIGTKADIAWVLPGTAQSVAREIDLMSPSHVRYTAARDERDVFIKRSRAITWGHFFDKKDDPNAITEDEMLAGALGIVAGVRRSMRAIEMGGTYNPLVELDDTVGSVGGDSYLVDNVTVSVLADSSSAPVAQARYKLSGDWFGSLDPSDVLSGNWNGEEDGENPTSDGGTVLAAMNIPGAQMIYLAWNDTEFVKTGFRLERSTNGVDFTLLATVSASTLEYTNTGLGADTTYYYRVRPFSSSRAGSWSNIARARTDDGSLNDTTYIAGMSIPNSKNIMLFWSDTIFSETGYHIERCTDGVSFASLADVGASVQSYLDTSGVSGTTYYYRVCPFDGGGSEAWSNTVVLTAGEEVGETIVTVLSATSVQGAQIIDLAWNGSPYNKIGFHIERSLDGTTFTVLPDVSETTLDYSDTGLEPETTYYYRVAPYNSAGAGAWSNIASATTSTMDMDIFPLTWILDDFNRGNQGPPPGKLWERHEFNPTYPIETWALVTKDGQCATHDVDNESGIPFGNQTLIQEFAGNCEFYCAVSDSDPVYTDNWIGHAEGWYYARFMLTLNGIEDLPQHKLTIFSSDDAETTGSNLSVNNVEYASAEGFTIGDKFGIRVYGNKIAAYKNGAKIIETDNLAEPYQTLKFNLTLTTTAGSSGYPTLSIDNLGGGNL